MLSQYPSLKVQHFHFQKKQSSENNNLYKAILILPQFKEEKETENRWAETTGDKHLVFPKLQDDQ